VKRPITIAGGGLAGLSLGIALRQREVPVTVVEATSYPRHRVCGEFISGIEEGELQELGIAGLFENARRHVSTAWFESDRLWLRQRLPDRAYGLSRHFLDNALADRFVGAGGTLRCGERQEMDGEGIVWANGRARSDSGWLGIKAHYEDLELSDDLEIHLQDGGYVGLTRVEGNRVNVCGLFRHARTDGTDVLGAACEKAGLRTLAGRLRDARAVTGSIKGVTNFALGWQRAVPGRMCVGDAAAMIPPFTGNGMTMAIQGAMEAAEPVDAWSRGAITWDDAVCRVRVGQRKTFSRRLRWARILHTIMFYRATRRIAMALVASGRVSFTRLYTKVR
jgi:flavin-dependent dehydrogenase